jgi:hypothetical protein
MSCIVYREPGLLVMDGLLPAAGFQRVCREVAHSDYRSVHAQKWDKAWHLWDGQPLRGESVYFDPRGAFGWTGATYPTRTFLDALVVAVRLQTAACPEVAGTEGVDWIALYLAPWLYPVGSALALHRDAGRFSGSFAYFAHARWNRHWGGDLIVSPPVPPGTPRVDAPRTPDSADDEPWISEDAHDDPRDLGIATCVSPRPNRLVLLGADRPHRMTRVDPNAGAHVRASIAGFFLRPP